MLRHVNILLLTVRFLDVSKVYYSNYIIITNSNKRLFSVCRFKNIFPAYFGTEIP
jgi:hypothetical protein